MPVDQKAEALRAALRRKTDEELKALLAAAVMKDTDSAEDEDFVPAIMEVIGEREDGNTVSQAELDAAWEDLQKRIQKQITADTGTAKEDRPTDDLPIENSRTMSRRSRLSRYCAIAAAAVLILCGTSLAFGFNMFQAIADWTAEQFRFVTPADNDTEIGGDPFRNLRLAVAEVCDTPGVPTWAPEGTMETDNARAEGRSDRVIIRCGYEAGDVAFSIRIVVYASAEEDSAATYQKSAAEPLLYEAGGVTHYLLENNDRRAAVWRNGNLECSIQGDLTINELERMIDSIYEG